MYWLSFFVCAAAVLLASVAFAVVRGKTKYKRGRFFEPSRIIVAGIVLSAIILFVPVYLNTFKENNCGVIETALIAVHNMIRLFVVDGDFSFITDNISGLSGWLYYAYSIFFSVLFVVAPLATFGFVLSFFQNVSAYTRYLIHCKSEVFIFSELNERSLALAKSLYKNNKNRVLVFTDVFEKKEEQSYEMIEQGKEIGAIFFKKDITAVKFTSRNKKRPLNFFAIGEDENENISQALKIVASLKYRENTNLYVVSTQESAETLMTNAFNKTADEQQDADEIKIVVRRVNEVESLINRTLYAVGYEKIFKSAHEDESGLKHISAVVIGMGRHGSEMTKALAWFCQMDGYQAEINAFDMSKTAQAKFESGCPELMDEKFNGNFDVDGESKYKITIHSDMDVDTKTFDDAIVALPKVTYVFVSLGDDEKNISTAIKVRSLLAKKGNLPEIQAIVYNTDKNEALDGITNFQNKQYNIDFIGDMKESYSEEVILGTGLEKEALGRHLKWGDENSFWKYSYNYKSSIASAIHRKMKIACGIPGADKPVDQRTEEEKLSLRKLEHCRWNAYMRSIGYSYSGSKEKGSRNDMAKLHNCLVPFEELSEADKAKDDD